MSNHTDAVKNVGLLVQVGELDIVYRDVHLRRARMTFRRR